MNRPKIVAFLKLTTSMTAITSMLLFSVQPMAALAAAQANYTNTGAPTATFEQGSTNNLVLDVTLPDAMNGVGTEDTLIYDGASNSWNGNALVAFDSAEPDINIFIDHAPNNGVFTNGEDVLVKVDGWYNKKLAHIGLNL